MDKSVTRHIYLHLVSILYSHQGWSFPTRFICCVSKSFTNKHEIY